MIYTLNALAGAGKTYSLAKLAYTLASRGQKVLIIQPTRMLIDATSANEIMPRCTSSLKITKIYGSASTPDDEAVGKRIIDHFIDADPHEGEILLITQSAFVRVGNFHNAANWVLICDEAMPVFKFTETVLPDNHDILTKHIGLSPVANGYCEMEMIDDHLKVIARNRGKDAVYAVFQELASDVLSDHHMVLVAQDHYNRLIGQKIDNLTALSILLPTIFQQFRDAYLASALLEDSLHYIIWKAIGTQMTPVPANVCQMKYTTHQNGHLLKIFYASDEPWSKAMRKKAHEINGRKINGTDIVIELTKGLFGQSGFVWMGNRDHEAIIREAFPSASQLPNSPHGLNSFTGFDDCVVFSALGLSSDQINFLRDAIGIDPGATRNSIFHSAVYQAMMRISLRNPNSQTPCRLFVMDKGSAEWIGALFPGCRIEQLVAAKGVFRRGKAGRPPATHKKSAAQASKDYRKRKKEAKRLAGLVGGAK